jgi:hypothetical protein
VKRTVIERRGYLRGAELFGRQRQSSVGIGELCLRCGVRTPRLFHNPVRYRPRRSQRNRAFFLAFCDRHVQFSRGDCATRAEMRHLQLRVVQAQQRRAARYILAPFRRG